MKESCGESQRKEVCGEAWSIYLKDKVDIVQEKAPLDFFEGFEAVKVVIVRDTDKERAWQAWRQKVISWMLISVISTRLT